MSGSFGTSQKTAAAEHRVSGRFFSGKEHFHRNEKWREPKWHHRSKYVGNYYKEKDTRRNNGSPK